MAVSDNQLKLALDETRLLLLGGQVLAGFAFEMFFQPKFEDLSTLLKYYSMATAMELVGAIGLLVLPSLFHRLTCGTSLAKNVLLLTSGATSFALVLIACALGCGSFVVVSRSFGPLAGVAAAFALGGIAVAFWFGLELAVGIKKVVPKMSNSRASLTKQIEQVLTEARVIIPGAQALIGFQFIAMLTSAFDELPRNTQLVHVAALVLVIMNMILLMTPAALHRLSFAGSANPAFLSMASGMVIVAPLFLAGGLSAELYVIFGKVVAQESSAGAAVICFTALIAAWYIMPLWLRKLLNT
jgi:hypothetical protein